MSNAKSLIKGIVKKPGEKPTFGTNPRDPWSATGGGGGVGIAENVTSRRSEVLQKFYKSRGYNINYVDKNKRISQSKAGDFEKWKQDRGIFEEDQVSEDTLNELSTDTLASYKKKSGEAASAADAKGDFKTGDKRFSGIVKATNKQFSNDAKKHVQKEETLNELSPHTTGEYIKHAAVNAKYQVKVGDKEKEAKRGKGISKAVDRLTKAATLVKEIYAQHRLKEDMYDHEKDNKGPGSFGKAPKTLKKMEVNDDDSKGVNARMVLKGGTTMTGAHRDTIEIDPMMKNRNKTADYMGQDSKKQQNNNNNK